MLARAGSIAALLSIRGEERHTGCGHSTVGKARAERRRPRRACRMDPHGHDRRGWASRRGPSPALGACMAPEAWPWSLWASHVGCKTACRTFLTDPTASVVAMCGPCGPWHDGGQSQHGAGQTPRQSCRAWDGSRGGSHDAPAWGCSLRPQDRAGSGETPRWGEPRLGRPKVYTIRGKHVTISIDHRGGSWWWRLSTGQGATWRHSRAPDGWARAARWRRAPLG